MRTRSWENEVEAEEDKMNGLVSIIVPVYNTEKYIETCIQSIIKQTYRNLEIILVNDGSQQEEEAIIHGRMKQDGRIRYIKNEKNQGLFLTRLRGLQQATGQYVMFVDSDDYISFDYVRLLVEEAEKEGADITFSTTVLNTPKEKKVINVFQDVALYGLPLSGENVRRAFFGQEGAAYVWHTIWNKLYTKELWVQCLPYFEKMRKHIVMTEDLAFSCILFYFANRIARSENSVYYYCQHAEASTSVSRMSFAEYEKKFTDIKNVFRFLENFFEDREAQYRNKLSEFKQYYARLWKRGIVNIVDGKHQEAEALFVDFCDDLGEGTVTEDGYFNSAQAPYSDKLDEIKKKIWYSEKKYVSFDIFDTVITRPFYDPADLFWLLDKIYDDEQSNTSFFTIRKEGEAGCRESRCNECKEDVTIEEIYEYISENYGLPTELCTRIKQMEIDLEVSFSQNRKAVHELYDIALLSGKKVIFTSDMYLSKDTIAKILNKNGYYGYEEIFVSSECAKLKATGNLFKQIGQMLQADLEELIHVGDNLVSDVKAPAELGITTIHVPKAIDVFRNQIPEISTNRCFDIAKNNAGAYRGQKGFENINGYGCMIAMVANRYFDNPFRPFHPMTDFNMDAFFAGYYVLGMNLVAQIQWLEQARKKGKIRRVIFMARDGYLLKQAYDSYLAICEKDIETKYMYASRKAMLPVMLKKKADFMNLPIVYQQYTPDMIVGLLEFCASDMSSTKWYKICKENGFAHGTHFGTIFEYHFFMRLFWEQRYDAQKHECSKRLIREYWSGIVDTDGIFDMGYSASIHSAVAQVSEKCPTALFIHTDRDKHLSLERRSDFTIISMMDSIPNISGLMREFFFSDVECGSCIGYQKRNHEIMPLLETESKSYVDKFPLAVMQHAAIEFVKDFYRTFCGFLPYLDIRTNDVSMPFEGFLCSPSKPDTKIFMASYFEDKIYGAHTKLNVRDFWLQLLVSQAGYQGNDIIGQLEEFLREKGKEKLAFFGTGRMCRDILDANPSMPVSVFLDNDADKCGREWYGCTIASPDSVDDIKKLYIVIVCAAYMEIEEQLEDMGLVKFEDYITYMEIF